jgi:hypothetical protein
MRQIEDLTGRIFGDWKVIERAEDHILPSGKTVTMWLCECMNEGNRGVVMGSNLKNGMSTSCGCNHKRRSSESHFEDLTGQIFGNLKVIERAEDWRKDKMAIPQWYCECLNDGNIIVAQASNLKMGNTTSCGCSKQSSIASDIKNYCIRNYNGEQEHKVIRNPKTGFWLKCDVYIEKTPGDIDGTYIEVHGPQHYRAGFFTKTSDEFKDSRYRDQLKKNYAKKHGTYIEIDLRKITTSQDAIDYLEKCLDNIGRKS